MRPRLTSRPHNNTNTKMRGAKPRLYFVNIREGLHDPVLAQLLLPFPSRSEHLIKRCVGRPAKHLIGLAAIAPNLLDITLAARTILPIELNTRSLLKGLHNLQRGVAVTCTNVEVVDSGRILIVKHATHSGNVSLSQLG